MLGDVRMKVFRATARYVLRSVNSPVDIPVEIPVDIPVGLYTVPFDKVPEARAQCLMWTLSHLYGRKTFSHLRRIYSDVRYSSYSDAM